MTRFAATVESEAVVAAERERIWAVLSDPRLLAELTPLLRTIETDGKLWRWQLVKIAALGVSISPCMTERMSFQDGRRIDYAHEPPQGTVERSGANGRYVLSDVPSGTRLAISLTLHVELPRLTSPAVTRIMRATMMRTGEKFAANLLRHLGVDRRITR